MRNPIILLCLCLTGFLVAQPVPTDDRLQIQLVASEPQIVTPTGISVDTLGRIWVIENNTHFRPKTYTGPAGDRILVMDQFAPDGRATRITTFADGLKDSMSLTVRPNGDVYLVTRNQISLLRDTTGAGRADQRTALVTLDTEADYPHNGLNGIAFAPTPTRGSPAPPRDIPQAELYFCLGLNVGKPYKLSGSDGSTLSGGGEGGSMYRCNADGSALHRVATGFWNVHDLCFDAFGRLLAVDNDPDDRPPCRLIDIIEGGDYGWQYRNGRKGIHPFTDWFGQRPGSLPMISPVGEAPSGILACESAALPPEYRGQILVTSWGDHVVQHFTLKPQGASFTSEPQILVQGGQDFRPVGIALAPDGSLVLSDWVDKSYAVHGKGRVWRLKMKTPPAQQEPTRLAALDPSDLSQRANDSHLDPRSRIAAMWSLAPLPAARDLPNSGLPIADPDDAVRCEALRLFARFAEPQKVTSALTDAIRTPDLSPAVYRALISALPPGAFPVPNDPHWPRYRDDRFVFSAALTSISRSADVPARLAALPTHDEPEAILAVLAFRRSGTDAGLQRLPDFLKDPRPGVRRCALQWLGEERLQRFAGLIPQSLKAGPVTRDVLLAAIAAKEKLSTEPPAPGKPPTEHTPGQLAVDFVFDATLDLAIRQLALQLSDPRDPRLSAAKLKPLLTDLGEQVVRALCWRDEDAAQQLLREVASDDQRPMPWRLEAAAGLARSATLPATRALLLDLLHHGPAELRLESLRSLRGTLTAADVRDILLDFDKALAKGAHAGEADRREFAEQILLAVKSTPDAITPADLQRLTALAGPRPADEAAWQTLLSERGDADAGRRVFFHAKSAQCFVCHTIDSRGGVVGPDLSALASGMSRAKIVESILFPSREIAPMYVPVTVTLRDGSTYTGVGLEEIGPRTIRLTDSTGKFIQVDSAQVVSRRLEKISLMPDGLPDAMTRREFRDLIEFLAQQK